MGLDVVGWAQTRGACAGSLSSHPPQSSTSHGSADDLGGLAEEPVRLRRVRADRDTEHHHPARPCRANEFDPIGCEGVFLFKANDRYHLPGAGRYDERNNCMTAESPTLRGPDAARGVSVPHAGHSTFFQDTQGDRWSTMFGNDSQAPIQKPPVILRVEFDASGHIGSFVTGETWQPKRPGKPTEKPP
jgi:hypothetical protein